MSTFAIFFDYFLYLVFAASLGLSGYKLYDIWIKPVSLENVDIDDLLFQKEEGLTLLSAIATTAPFIGLLGTVLHIIIALKTLGFRQDIAALSVISGPIATALTATLVGIFAALPAMLVYNLAQRKLARMCKEFDDANK